MSSNSSFHGSDREGSTSVVTDNEGLDLGHHPSRDLPPGLLHEPALSVSPSRDHDGGIVERSGKRKQTFSGNRQWKKVKLYYDDAYLQFFNQTMAGQPNSNLFHASKALWTTQIGAVTWASEEKDLFFDALARKGRGDLKAIAEIIGTKSEPEVHAYLRLLGRGVREYENFHPSITQAEIPAASEISQICETHLDRCAEAVVISQEQFDNAAGQEHFRDTWIVDADTAMSIDNRIRAELDDDINKSAGEYGVEDKAELSPAHELFRLSTWVELSERVFMNPGSPMLGENWKNIVEEGESPSMTQAAVSDFYSLALSLTRRLVQSSIWLAMSRIRSSRYDSQQPGAYVRYCDIRAACDVLQIKPDSNDFWTKAARRCNLEVVDIQHKKRCDTKSMSYEAVEQTLSEVPIRGRNRRASSASADSSSLASSMAVSSEVSGYDLSEFGQDEDNARLEEPDSPSAVSSEPKGEELRSPLPDSAPQEFDNEHDFWTEVDVHADCLDKMNSYREEIELWKLIGRKPPEDLDLEVSQNVPARSEAPWKTEKDLVDWREKVLCQNEWEQLLYRK